MVSEFINAIFCPTKTRRLGNLPVQECKVYRPERTRELESLVRSNGSTYISRGLGRAYGDSSLNPDGVILQTRLNRLKSFDPATGIVECEAGVSLAELIETFLPHGFFLPVTPGTKFVTVGGAIAADVHGKNHHRDGTFGQFVQELNLLTASGEIITCGPDQNPDMFWATVGGMGLTGAILTARVRLIAVPSAYIAVEYKRTENLDQTLDAFKDDEKYHYSVAWIDCLASGASLGRSVLMRGDHAPASSLSSRQQADPFRVNSGKRAKSIPFNFPAIALNRMSVKTFNALFYASHKDKQSIVHFDPYFYPLDSTLHWNRMYGKRGFIQYQAFFPRETSSAGLKELLEAISARGVGSFLAVLKSSGPGNASILSFLRAGHTLALDIPYREGIESLTQELDRILLKHGGRLYLAKDATMSRETFAEMYPELARFREIKGKLDPMNRFVSSQARRVGIVGGQS